MTYCLVTGERIYPVDPWVNIETSTETFIGFNLGVFTFSACLYQLFLFRLKQEAQERDHDEVLKILTGTPAIKTS